MSDPDPLMPDPGPNIQKPPGSQESPGSQEPATSFQELAIFCFQELAGSIVERFVDPAARGSECIGMTRLAAETLKNLGIPAKPWAVGWTVCAKKLEFAYVCGLRGENLLAAKSRAKSYRKRKVKDGPGWDGHLVLITENRWVIDASFAQCAAHPGMTGIPQVFVIDTKSAGFIGCEQPEEVSKSHIKVGIRLDSGLELAVEYWPLNEDEAIWRNTEAWTDPGAKKLGRILSTAILSAIARRERGR